MGRIFLFFCSKIYNLHLLPILPFGQILSRVAGGENRPKRHQVDMVILGGHNGFTSAGVPKPQAPKEEETWGRLKCRPAAVGSLQLLLGICAGCVLYLQLLGREIESFN